MLPVIGKNENSSNNTGCVNSYCTPMPFTTAAATIPYQCKNHGFDFLQLAAKPCVRSNTHLCNLDIGRQLPGIRIKAAVAKDQLSLPHHPHLQFSTTPATCQYQLNATTTTLYASQVPVPRHALFLNPNCAPHWHSTDPIQCLPYNASKDRNLPITHSLLLYANSNVFVRPDAST